MKYKSAKAIVFLSTLMVGFLIAANFNFDGFESSMQLDTREYQNAIEEKQKLLSQIASLKEDNEEIVNKIDEYSNNDREQEKIYEDMKNQLSDYGMVTGLNEVMGPGIVITVNDGKYYEEDQTSYESWSKIFHDSDFALLLYQIRAAGAEAISVNNHRITSSSAVMCNSSYLGFDDGTQLYAPFNIYAIGNPEILQEALTKDLDTLKLRGLNVELQRKDEIVMKSANIRNLKYSTVYTDKK